MIYARYIVQLKPQSLRLFSRGFKRLRWARQRRCGPCATSGACRQRRRWRAKQEYPSDRTGGHRHTNAGSRHTLTSKTTQPKADTAKPRFSIGSRDHAGQSKTCTNTFIAITIFQLAAVATGVRVREDDQAIAGAIPKPAGQGCRLPGCSAQTNVAQVGALLLLEKKLSPLPLIGEPSNRTINSSAAVRLVSPLLRKISV